MRAPGTARLGRRVTPASPTSQSLRITFAGGGAFAPPTITAQRAAAARMHAIGVSENEIARRLEVRRETVCRWLAEPAVRAYVDELRAPSQAVVLAILRAAAVRAARVLVAGVHGRLRGPDVLVRLAAACSVLDRVGIAPGARRMHHVTVDGATTSVQIAETIARRRHSSETPATRPAAPRGPSARGRSENARAQRPPQGAKTRKALTSRDVNGTGIERR